MVVDDIRKSENLTKLKHKYSVNIIYLAIKIILDILISLQSSLKKHYFKLQDMYL